MNWDININQKDVTRYSWPIKRLFFSGEGTSLKYSNYVHGAYYSGLDTISEILQCMGKNGKIKVNFNVKKTAPKRYNKNEKIKPHNTHFGR